MNVRASWSVSRLGTVCQYCLFLFVCEECRHLAGAALLSCDLATLKNLVKILEMNHRSSKLYSNCLLHEVNWETTDALSFDYDDIPSFTNWCSVPSPKLYLYDPVSEIKWFFLVFCKFSVARSMHFFLLHENLNSLWNLLKIISAQNILRAPCLL